MDRIRFYQLPLWVRLACALTLLNTWILIAEFVIDRYELDTYLPFYRYGDVCIWDIGVIAAIIVMFVRGSRIPSDAPAVDTGCGERESMTTLSRPRTEFGKQFPVGVLVGGKR